MEARPKGITKKYNLGTGPIPIEAYTSQEYFEREREAIFRHAWLNVGRLEDIAKPGDFLVKDIHVLDTSVLVVRQSNGEVKAFHNVCQHRGNRVVPSGAECGSAKGFACSFHGWTYGLDGKLAVVPDEAEFFDFDRGAKGLKPIATDVWEGFIFVNADPEESLRQSMGEIADLFPGYFDGYKRISSYRADVKVNWKVALDAFQEAYHAPFLHGKAYPDQIAWSDNQFAHLLGVELYKRHRALSIEGNPNHMPTGVAEVLFRRTGNVFTALKGAHIDMGKLPKGVNPTRDSNWAFDIYVVFPNFYIATMRTMPFVTYHFWPVAADRTIWQTDHYMPAPKTASELLSQHFSKAFARDVQREDLITLENTQSVLLSGAITSLTLSDQEVALRHGYKVVDDLIRERRNAPRDRIGR